MMLSCRPLALAAVAAVAFIGCAAQKAPPRDPFSVPREQILQNIRTVALTEISLPDNIIDPEAVKKEFQGLIRATLEAGGFSTIPQHQFESRWKAAVAEAGGIYDPVTGQLKEELAKQLRRKVYTSLRSELGADGVLVARIVPVAAGFKSGKARWDGAWQVFQPGAATTEPLLGYWTTGSVPALSLQVWLWDVDENVVYSNAGGIEVTSTMSFGRFLDVPAKNLLKDSVRNSQSVGLALTPLTVGPPPAED